MCVCVCLGIREGIGAEPVQMLHTYLESQVGVVKIRNGIAGVRAVCGINSSCLLSCCLDFVGFLY